MRAVVFTLLLWASALPAGAAEVLVAVASNFSPTLAELARGFEAASGHRVKAAAGPTGRLHAQIVAGAPFEVLLAADEVTPARLVQSGHAVAASRFTYAQGQLALWSAQPGLVDAHGAVLASPVIRHLAIANPRLAPYGQAALEVLRARGLEQAWAGRLVMAESVGQAQAYVASGNAELGFVAAAQVLQGGRLARGSVWLVPAHLHAPIRQQAVLLQAGEHSAAAQAFMQYLASAPARAVILAHGYLK